LGIVLLSFSIYEERKKEGRKEGKRRKKKTGNEMKGLVT